MADATVMLNCTCTIGGAAPAECIQREFTCGAARRKDFAASFIGRNCRSSGQEPGPRARCVPSKTCIHLATRGSDCACKRVRLQGEFNLTQRALGAPLSIDTEIHKSRHLIENFFCKLKEFKRIALRADKTDASFEAMIYAVAALINSR